MRSRIAAAFILQAGLSAYSCTDETVYSDLRIYASPYAEVDWSNSYRIKSQHHDHTGIDISRIRAYDAAGYDAISLMDYSGNPGQTGAWQQRIWPPELWLPPELLSSLENIELFIPNAEEVGIPQHGTSPFLTRYIEGVSGAPSDPSTAPQYGSIAEMFDLIREEGGFPCLAHPWDYRYENFGGAYCVEIYTAFAEAKRIAGDPGFTIWDRNATLMLNWDIALTRNQQAFGIAVNDHFGPYNTDVAATAVDSGKIVVLASDLSLEAYRAAFERGAFFAIKDMRTEKRQDPQISRIDIRDDAISIEATGRVTWISSAVPIGTGTTLLYTAIPANSRYVRAEISNGPGSAVVYTQAFAVRPRGDIDGDYQVNAIDDQICRDLQSDDDPDDAVVAACAATSAATQ